LAGAGVEFAVGAFPGGFQLPEEGLVALTEAEAAALGFRRGSGGGEPEDEPPPEAAASQLAAQAEEFSLADLDEGDFAVHVEHGIGIFRGLRTLKGNGLSREVMVMEFRDGQLLYVPLLQAYKVSRYLGAPGKVKLHALGGSRWNKEKERARFGVRSFAADMLRLQAMRNSIPGIAFRADAADNRAFVRSFPYPDTPDQRRATLAVAQDMSAPRPMDRLICGDVGYGKTEVAIRAAFKVVNSGRQAAVLVPTTILAQQHYLNFCERFAPYPIRVELLSRFRSAKEQKQTFQRLASGECDIVIGTHRLLAKDLEFKNLGLLIVDEEHRFGVMHKNKLKKLKADIDVMTMSATPIPRTLQMSFYGIREMSLIETPPEERLPVKTYLFERRTDIIKAAVARELNRQGQVYFLHNRVETIERTAADLQRLLPKARIAVGHGQMKESLLEEIMMDFYEGHYDILVCSTIIESGLDVPNVNTIIIDNAHCMGLAQLYQLRGRVGRSAKQGYCYLLCPPTRQLTPDAQKRLKTIREFTHLGAGYQVAKRDLEIRGAGNMLGAEQSGHVTAVGFSLYCKMLEDAIRELRREKSPLSESKAGKQTIILELPISAHLPESYVPDSQQKVALYKRLALINDADSLQDFREELLDRYGKLPQTASNLLDIVRLKIKCTEALVPTLRIDGDILTVVAPFLRPLVQKELYGLTKITGWPVRQENSSLRFRNLFGNAVGQVDYPPDSVLLEQLFKILQYLKELPPQAPPEPLLSTNPRRLSSTPFRRSRFGGFR
ncbi:transcription-repair coupling factor, partial [bacterium]|nr:transcription-repair coupling factor [bacterium]